LVDSIKGAINGARGPFPNSKFRSDYYHLILQKWLTGKATFKLSEEADKLCSVLERWIKSWFDYCLTEAECTHSTSKFKSALVTHSDILGQGMLCVAEDILRTFEEEIETCAKFKFQRHTTLGFIGSGLVESMNPSIKCGPLGAKPSMGLDRSTTVQLKQVEARTHKMDCDMAKDMNKFSLWSKSPTFKLLTKYMEGKLLFHSFIVL
jgi:hypothetical protein